MRILILVTAMVFASQMASAGELRPVKFDSFWVTPGEPATLRWWIDGPADSAPPTYTLRNTWQEPAGSGEASNVFEDVAEVNVKLPPGYYELEFSGTDRRFGIVSLPAFATPRDDFFAIDSALSWLVPTDDLRHGLIRSLRRAGITMSRERLSWNQIQPGADTWDWESPRRYESLRRICHAEGVDVLEMFHDSPRWPGHVGKYPDDLVAASRAWREIGRRGQANWAALEIWNEPDIQFGDNLPDDQYVSLAKAVCYGLESGGVMTPRVGGVLAHFKPDFVRNMADNGLLDLVDAASFHTYGRAMEMEPLVKRFRDWLCDHKRGSMPLWITECGRPWKVGPPRPPADQDAESALDIVMKGVEARACGVTRYFPFVYPFYEEGKNNFSMTGRDGTPLRSMAAYAQLVRRLAGKRFLGDLSCDDAAIKRARLFGDDRETIAVVYTGKPQKDATIPLGLAVQRLEGIDGRELSFCGEKLPVPDGLVYAWVDSAQLGDRFRADVPAARLAPTGETVKKKPASPIVLRYQFDRSLVKPCSEGYKLTTTASEFPVTVRAFNLSPQESELVVSLTTDRPQIRAIGSAEQSIRVPAESHVDIDWKLDIGQRPGEKEHASITVSARGAAALPLVIDILP